MKNLLYPLKPNYKGKTKGWFAWLHHDTILEYSENVLERTEYVFACKPKNEIKERTEHMIYIPDNLLPKYLYEAKEKLYEAEEKLYEAKEKLYEAEEKLYEAKEKWHEAKEKWHEAKEKLYEAEEKRDEAEEKSSCSPKVIKYLKDNTPYSWDNDNKTLVSAISSSAFN